MLDGRGRPVPRRLLSEVSREREDPPRGRPRCSAARSSSAWPPDRSRRLAPPLPEPDPGLPPRIRSRLFSTNASRSPLAPGLPHGNRQFVNTDADARVAKRLEGIAVRDDVPGVSVIAADSVGRACFYPEADGTDSSTGRSLRASWPDGGRWTPGQPLPRGSPWWTQGLTLPWAAPGREATTRSCRSRVPATALEHEERRLHRRTLQAGTCSCRPAPATVFRYRAQRRLGASGVPFRPPVPGGAADRDELPCQDLLARPQRDDPALRHVRAAGLPDFASGCAAAV